MRHSKYMHIIKDKVNSSKPGTFFFPADFYYLTDFRRVSVSLNRLSKRGILEHMFHGVYMKPGETPPGADDIARAIARNRGWSIAPCGKTASYLAGDAKFEPKEWTFISDGMYHTYKYKGMIIKFKHTDKKGDIVDLPYGVAMCIQALKYHGKKGIYYELIEKLANNVELKDRAKLLFTDHRITAWIRKELIRVYDVLAEQVKVNDMINRESGWAQYPEDRRIGTLFDYKVRSKSEAMILTHLQLAGLDYEYEKFLASIDGIPHRPDFTINYKGKTFFWEHLGRMDDDDYVKKWTDTEKWYHLNFPGQLLTTVEPCESPDIGTQIKTMMLEKFNFSIPQNRANIGYT